MVLFQNQLLVLNHCIQFDTTVNKYVYILIPWQFSITKICQRIKYAITQEGKDMIVHFNSVVFHPFTEKSISTISLF